MRNIQLNRNKKNASQTGQSEKIFNRANSLRFFLFLAGFLLIGRLFYVQIIRHDYYQAQALAEHIKKYQIPSKRGLIYAMDGDKQVPIVLNEERYEVYVDPKFIEDPKSSSKKLSEALGIDSKQIYDIISDNDSRYAIVAKKVTKDQQARVKELKLKGVGARQVDTRTYPQGQFASQVLGFVNDDQVGQYGVEGSLNKDLSGKTGQLKAVTDVNGVPLAVNNDNIQTKPENGKDLKLTIDIGMQKITEDALADAITRTKADKATAVMIDANTGEVKAMANLPTYNPWEYQTVKDGGVFNNLAVTGAWEPGSVLKPIMLSTAFNEGTLNTASTFYDSMSVQVDDRKIGNSYPWGAMTMSMQDIITKSLNTGAVFILKSLGGGDITDKARTTWHDYLTKHFKFNEITGIEQTGESPGSVIGPNEGYGSRVRYANMSFGQGLSVTPIQLASSYATLVNGGTVYKPTLVKSVGEANNSPKVVSNGAITPQVSADIKNILKTALEKNNKDAVRAGYELGAKTGTAEIADSNGQYKKDAHNGVYVGFISGDNKTYILLVRLDEPKSARFASSEAATTWTQISNKLIDSYTIQPKK